MPTTEVVVTLKSPPLATFGRSLLSARHVSYLRRIESQQAVVSARIEQAIPSSRIRWRYKLVANGLAGGREAILVQTLGVQRASGTALDYLTFIPSARARERLGIDGA